MKEGGRKKREQIRERDWSIRERRRKKEWELIRRIKKRREKEEGRKERKPF